MLLVRSKLTTDFHIGWQSGAELTNQLRDADYGSKNDWCLVSRMSYTTKKQGKFKSLLMYCSIGLPTITADKLARVHSQSCTSHGPQVAQRKQNKLNLLFAAQPLFPRPRAPRVWFRRNTSSTRVSAGAPQARRNFWHPRTMSFTRTRRGQG